ncbi:MAG: mechanosensitive ion channel family protein [Limnochordia bacterium]|jgi:small conductance mechanosensitive channel
MDLDSLVALAVPFVGRILAAIILILVGRRLIARIVNLVSLSFRRHPLDTSLQSFAMSATRGLLFTLLVVTTASVLGVQMTSVAAILASAGLAVGLALQGSLSNLAGGVLLLSLKPFRVGDFVEVGALSGTVEAIQMFYTLLRTPDNRQITIPNADLANSNITNFTANPTRRMDLVVAVSYDTDIAKVKSVLKKLADDHPLVLKDPSPMIVVGEHGPSALHLFFRVWVNRDDYWPVRFELLEQIKVAFDEAAIKIPFSQVEVHLNTAPKT